MDLEDLRTTTTGWKLKATIYAHDRRKLKHARSGVMWSLQFKDGQRETIPPSELTAFLDQLANRLQTIEREIESLGTERGEQ